MSPRSDKPALNELLGDESARGIELAVTPVVFGGFGWLVDGWLGTGPWLTLGLAAFALAGTIAKLWFTYDAQMRELESTSRWARGSRPAEGAAPADDVDLWSDRRAQA
ncbi:AtpZ/AtpI family protein [Acidimicrobiia bacterium EGI L10123]|uniref:AtpZ/AtpI family protein n=1 Tax=Salinilacustrithrix flava TaxID=2957203 RepID=UPI003D7C17EC|nr:AtpZ/AtpI family protein [Acidimicrobiia bacterium EGI L10123]